MKWGVTLRIPYIKASIAILNQPIHRIDRELVTGKVQGRISIVIFVFCKFFNIFFLIFRKNSHDFHNLYIVIKSGLLKD